MKHSPLVAFAVLLALLSAGCVHFDYEGEAFTPTASAKIYPSADQVPGAYEVIGKAVAYGDYQSIPKDKLEERMRAEAAKRGADAVIVTAQQVIPTGQAVSDFAGRALAAESSGNTNINEMERDFSIGYGNIRDAKPQTATVREYRRILRAEFIRIKTPAATAPVQTK